MHQTHSVQYNPPLSGVQPQTAYVARVPESRPPTKYTNQAATWALRLSYLQILSGIACVIFQAVATGLKRTFEKEERRMITSMTPYMGEADAAGTGIWFGILMVICGVVGVFAAKENKREQMRAHLGLNIIMLVLTPVLIGTTSSSIEEIGSCLNGYDSFFSMSNYDSNWYPYPRTTTTTQRTFLGLPVSVGCQTPFFKGWMAMVCLLLIIAVVNFVVALVLLVMNSKVLCGSCDDGEPQVPQQQGMCNPGYAPAQPFIVPLDIPHLYMHPVLTKWGNPRTTPSSNQFSLQPPREQPLLRQTHQSYEELCVVGFQHVKKGPATHL